MLNRRHLRVKVLQTLYAYNQSENKVARNFEKDLLKSVDEVNEMYIWVLSLLLEVADYVPIDAEDRANRHLPSENDLNASQKLFHNKFLASLRTSDEFELAVRKYKVSWTFDPEIAKSIFLILKDSPEYETYLLQADESIRAEKDIIKFIFKKIILKTPGVEQIFEEKFINWPIDKEVLQALIAKTFKNFSSEDFKDNKLADILSNVEEDKAYIQDLFNKTIAYSDEYQNLISLKTKNWEADRIALMDVLLMKMAITEAVHFTSIPVKVTINEFLEISKEYSTPKSNAFINGILDKIFADLKSEGKIRKFGRGLL